MLDGPCWRQILLLSYPLTIAHDEYAFLAQADIALVRACGMFQVYWAARLDNARKSRNGHYCPLQSS
jgi:hypothetical protein